MNLSIKAHKRRFVITMVAYLLAMSALFMIRVYDGVNNGLTLKVRTHGNHLGSYKDQHLTGNNHFISGIQGDLYWRPRTLTESALLITADNKDIDFLDIRLMIIAVIVIIMFKDSREGTVFTKNLSSGFMLLVFGMGIIGMLLDMAKAVLARTYIPYITNGQFTGNFDFKVITFYYMVYPILLFLLWLPKKGLELQKEAELTI
jgi:hypothetical protein